MNKKDFVVGGKLFYIDKNKTAVKGKYFVSIYSDSEKKYIPLFAVNSKKEAISKLSLQARNNQYPFGWY